LRYVEIQLAKAQEEKETLGTRIKKMDEEHERQADNLANQMAINKQQGVQVQHLQKKIDSFSNNQSSLVEKSRFKASSYMEQIN